MLGKLSIWIMFFLDNRDSRDVLLIKELVPILHHQSFIVFFFKFRTPSPPSFLGKQTKSEAAFGAFFEFKSGTLHKQCFPEGAKVESWEGTYDCISDFKSSSLGDKSRSASQSPLTFGY